MNYELRKGFSAIEVLLGSAILAVVVSVMATGILFGQEGTALSGTRNRASLIAEEGIEALRNIRDANFSNLLTGTYGLSTAGNVWNLSGTSDTTDIFTRTVSIATISGDDNRKYATASTTWTQTPQRGGSTSFTTRLTNWHRQFGNWATPSQSASITQAGNNAGIELALSGRYVYFIRAGGTPDFSIIDVNAPDSPVVVGSMSLAGTPADIAVSGNFAYVASNQAGQQLQIINISNPASPTLAGTFSAANQGTGVAVVGTTVYLMTTSNANNFYIIDASNPASPTQLSRLSRPGSLHEVVVMGNLAYVSSDSNSNQLQIFDVSNSSAPTLVVSFAVPPNGNTPTITGFRNPNTVFLGRANGNVNIIDVSTPATPNILATFAGGGASNDVALGLSSGYLLVGGSAGSAQVRTLDISTLASPTSLGVFSVGQTVNGVVYDQTRDRVYVAKNTAGAQFIVLKPL